MASSFLYEFDDRFPVLDLIVPSCFKSPGSVSGGTCPPPPVDLQAASLA
jgi:hypothetical protein